MAMCCAVDQGPWTSASNRNWETNLAQQSECFNGRNENYGTKLLWIETFVW